MFKFRISNPFFLLETRGFVSERLPPRPHCPHTLLDAFPMSKRARNTNSEDEDVARRQQLREEAEAEPQAQLEKLVELDSLRKIYDVGLILI